MADLKDFLEKNWMQGKEKHVIVFLCLLLASATILCFFSVGAPTLQASTEEKASVPMVPALPLAPQKVDIAAAKAVTLRDPFEGAGTVGTLDASRASKESASAPMKNARIQRQDSLSVPTKQTTPAKLVVSGIAACGENRVAIFEYGLQHLLCRENEAVGPYRVLSIATDEVRLQGPNGVMTLQVGQ